MFTHNIQVRVRYGETDQMGYVYYGNYATYYEIARVEALRHIGLPYKELEERGVGMPVFDMQVKYHKPAKYDDLLEIQVSIPEMPRARINFQYEIRNQAGDLLNTGSTSLVFIDMESGRPIRLPKELAILLENYYTEQKHT